MAYKTYPTTYFPDATEASIRAAAAAALAAGAGDIYLPDAAIDISGGALPLYSNVRYFLAQPRLTFSTLSPADAWTGAGGTRLYASGAQAGTFPAFSDGKTDQGSTNPSTFGRDAIYNTAVIGGLVAGFSSAFKTGAVNAHGALWSNFENILAESCTDFAFQSENHMQCRFQRLRTRDSRHVARFAATCDSQYSPGNSWYQDIFGVLGSTYDRLLSRGIVFEANGSGVVFNQAFGARLQVNHFNRTKLSQTCTPAGVGSANLTVQDGTKFAVGMPVAFTATANGFTGYTATAPKIYVVLSVSGNTITVGNSRTASALTATGTTGMTIESWGFPNLELVKLQSSASIQNFDLRNLDLEGASSASLYMDGAASCSVMFSQGGANTHADIALRGSNYNIIDNGGNGKLDIDGSSVISQIRGNRSGQADRTGIGIYRDLVSGTTKLSLGGAADQLEGRAPSGGSYIYPVTGFGQRSSPLGSTGAIALNAGRLGDLAWIGTAIATMTLPTITDDAGTGAQTSYIGARFEIHNCSSNGSVLTVNTDGTQTFNNQTGKVSTTLNAGESLIVTGSRGNGSTFFWTAKKTAAPT